MTPDSLLKGAYDLHVHCSPDVVPRAQDCFDLAESARELGLAGVGLKDHTTSTAGRCHTLNRLYPDGPRFFSSIALNPPVGGLNPSAVESALQSGVDIVYFPTYAADHHIATLGEDVSPVPHPIDGIQRLSVFTNEKGTSGLTTLGSNVIQILKLIAKHDAVLGTGHLSPKESLVLLEQASELGVQRMVVTHASQKVPGMSVADQRRAVACGALIEHSFLAVTECCPGRIPLTEMAQQIQEVGVDNVLLSSDFGQPDNGPPAEAFREHVERLQDLGFSPSQLRTMLRDNPERLIRPKT